MAIEVGTIIAKEVPTAKCINIRLINTLESRNIKNKNGTVINPPPIPNKSSNKTNWNGCKYH